MKSFFIKSLSAKALNLQRKTKIILAISLDTVLCLTATWIALCLRLNDFIDLNLQFFIPATVSVLIAIPILLMWGIYKVIFRYISGDTFQILTKAITLYTFIYFIIFVLFGVENIPRSIGLTQPMVFFLLIATSRWIVRFWLNQYFWSNSKQINKKEIIIYGAGNSGRQLASNIVHSEEFMFLFFIDDNRLFWGGTIDGYPVKKRTSLNNISNTNNAIELWLAMPNLSSIERGKIINDLRELRLHVRTLPSFNELTSQQIHLKDIRELNVNELVGREPVKPNEILLQKCIHKKNVLATGAGGSIGSEICRQIIINKPKVILLLDNSEIALYNIHLELKSVVQDNKDYDQIVIVPLLVNIQDVNHLDQVFKIWKPSTVYHAAAYKHVPMVEHNVVAGIKNNVSGTLNCANISIMNNIKNFVLVSTDKAVRPTNIMGASKRLAEMSLQLMNIDKNNNCTCFSIVRFGNVLGSSGSVVPLFRKQIENGGPITLTDKKVMRYFMTVEEAAQLVIQAGSMSLGGEVFVLDMGQPVRIIDLAYKMIETAGLMVKDKNTPWGDIEIKITGLRPGEKLFEELLIGKNPKPTEHARVLQANEIFLIKEDFENLTKKLNAFCDSNDIKSIQKLLKDNVDGYRPSKEVDLISNFDKHIYNNEIM